MQKYLSFDNADLNTVPVERPTTVDAISSASDAHPLRASTAKQLSLSALCTFEYAVAFLFVTPLLSSSLGLFPLPFYRGHRYGQMAAYGLAVDHLSAFTDMDAGGAQSHNAGAFALVDLQHQYGMEATAATLVQQLIRVAQEGKDRATLDTGLVSW